MVPVPETFAMSVDMHLHFEYDLLLNKKSKHYK